MSTSYSVPLNTVAEQAHHAPLDYLDASSRRKTVIILLMGVVILGLIGTVVKLALDPKTAIFAVQMPNGETYVITEPKKKIDIRQDVLAYESVKQDLNSWAESYFERSAVTAVKDWQHARWFLPDNLLAAYDDAAQGEKGWIKALQDHRISESHARIDAIEMREADILSEPYQARVYLTRTNLSDGSIQRSIATVSFVVRPDVWADPAHTQSKRFSRFPLYNALGVLVVKPVEETPDWRK